MYPRKQIFLGFHFQGQTFQTKVICFGVSLASWVSLVCIKAAKELAIRDILPSLHILWHFVSGQPMNLCHPDTLMFGRHYCSSHSDLVKLLCVELAFDKNARIAQSSHNSDPLCIFGNKDTFVNRLCSINLQKLQRVHPLLTGAKFLGAQNTFYWCCNIIMCYELKTVRYIDNQGRWPFYLVQQLLMDLWTYPQLGSETSQQYSGYSVKTTYISLAMWHLYSEVDKCRKIWSIQLRMHWPMTKSQKTRLSDAQQ